MTQSKKELAQPVGSVRLEHEGIAVELPVVRGSESEESWRTGARVSRPRQIDTGLTEGQFVPIHSR